MNERIQALWDAVKAWWERLSRIGRTLFLVAGGVIIIAIISLAVLFNRDEGPQYALLYNDLNTTETAQALSILSESQIVPEVYPDGRLMVLLEEVDQARILLAAGGFQADDFTYDVYAPGMTATQADKDRYEKWLNQNRIQNEIELTYTDVSQAVVNLSIPENNSFAFKEDLEDPAAAVVLSMRPDTSLSSQQVQGIVGLLMSSVPGLTEDKISIIDQTGDIKARLDSGIDVNNNKIALKQSFDELIRQKVLDIVEPMFGPGNVEVQANSMLDTDESVAETITYHPFDENNPMNNPADYAEWMRNRNGPEDAIVAGVPGANDNAQTPQYGQDQGVVAGLSSYDTHDIIDYLVSSTKEQIKGSGFKLTDMTVAVVVNKDTFADGQRDQIISLAANAAGVVPEKVSVVNYPFFAEAEPDTGGQPSGIATWMIIVGIILLVLIIALIVIAFLLANKKKKDEEEATLEEEVLYDEDGMPITDPLAEEDDFEPITIVETQEQKLKAQIKDLAESDPEIVAMLLKTWLG